jgi:HSP20 family protein
MAVVSKVTRDWHMFCIYLSVMMNLENILPWGFWMESLGLEGNTNFLDSDEAWTIEVLVPGYKKEDLKVTIEGDLLKIKSVKQESKDSKSKYLKKTFRVPAEISEVIRLPENHSKDGIEANVEAGILTVTIPKSTKKTLIEVL